jgi:phenylacetate-CoA ligase
MSNNLQNERFLSIIDHLSKVPFYRDKLRLAGIDLRYIKGLEDLPAIPFTTKSELRESAFPYRSPLSFDQLEFIFSSSGTSGSPTYYFWTHTDTEVLRDVGGRFMRRIGITEHDLALVIAPLGLSVMWYCMVQQYNAAGSGVITLGVQPPDVILECLAEHPVTVLITLPVVATRLAEYASVRRPELLPSIHLRQVHCGGDFLSEGRRRRIEAAWGASCYNYLGMSEIFGPFAGEGLERRGLCLAGDYIHAEVIDPQTKQPVEPGCSGVAVYTTLWPKGAPLLRYWSDDYVAMEDPAIDDNPLEPHLRYLGRSRDRLVRGPDAVFAQDIENVLLAHDTIGNEWQLTLDGKGGAIVRAEGMSPDHAALADIRNTLGELIGRQVVVEICPPGSLPRDIPKPERIVQSGG